LLVAVELVFDGVLELAEVQFEPLNEVALAEGVWAGAGEFVNVAENLIVGVGGGLG
jgi:hypothetical protein